MPSTVARMPSSPKQCSRDRKFSCSVSRFGGKLSRMSSMVSHSVLPKRRGRMKNTKRSFSRARMKRVLPRGRTVGALMGGAAEGPTGTR